MTDSDKEWFEYFAEGEFWDGIFTPIRDVMGMSAFAMFGGVVMFVSIYTWSGTLLLPTIILALFGGTLIAVAPPQVALIGTLMVVTAVAITLLTLGSER